MIMNNFEDIVLTKDELNFLKDLSKKDEIVLTNNEVRLYKALREEELIRVSFTQSKHIFKITTRGKSYLKFLKYRRRENTRNVLTTSYNIVKIILAIMGSGGLFYIITERLKYIFNLIFQKK